MKYQFAIIPYPFDDFSDVKPRPVLCLTEKIGQYNHIVVAMVTTQISKATEPSDLLLFSTSAAFSETGLRQDSAIRLHRLLTIKEGSIDQIFGELPEIYRADVENRLKSLLELP